VAEIKAELAAVGVELRDDAYLYSNDPAHARPWNPDWVSHRVAEVAAGAGVELDIKGGRHYTASQLLAGGFDLRNTAARLGVLMAAAAVSILELPLSATIITLLLTAKAGIATAPLIIVAVVVAYLTIKTLTPAPGRAAAAAPAAEPQPAAPSHATATADPGDGQT
jgi:hypothetical protein